MVGRGEERGVKAEGVVVDVVVDESTGLRSVATRACLLTLSVSVFEDDFENTMEKQKKT